MASNGPAAGRNIVLCPCGRWHRTVVFVTERYTHTYRCGLKVTMDCGEGHYEYKGKPSPIIDLAVGNRRFYIHLSERPEE